jgi:hypothetical protein
MIRSGGFTFFSAAVAAAAVVLAFASMENASFAQDHDYVPPGQHDQAPPPGDSGPPSRPPEHYDRDSGYGQPYGPPPDAYGPPPGPYRYSSDEIFDACRHFFGGVSKGLAQVVEYAFREEGPPDGYIIGEEAGGAIVAGLRYGKGTLFTKRFEPRPVFWQGPSIGYDFGGAGSRTLTLVYNLHYPEQIYERFGGVDGSAYFVAGAGITFLTADGVTLAPIRAGVGLRLGANVGYLKYTSSPTWNPF